MASLNPDPPATFVEAEERFSRFLVGQNYPPLIRWILPDEIALRPDRIFLVHCRGESKGSVEAAMRYHTGLERGFGILMQAICATPHQTVASVYIPTDLIDAQRHLIEFGLKLSCPTEKLTAFMIESSREWSELGHDIQTYSERMRTSLEI